MAKVYALSEVGTSKPLKLLNCKDEDKELQSILLNNFDLLPGDQIDPEAPCRWLLIKREMPVPDPSTGTDRWSIDFLFADQNATPTFVECKRYLDTRARREVVGQVLEYAANAQYFWTADDLRSFAELTAKENGTSLDEGLHGLRSEVVDSVENFFSAFEKKLKASEIRIIFFLEQAPPELKRLVEFMNKQLGTVEVLLVEARQYELEKTRIVVPTLFGFTEQIRQIKRDASKQQSRQPVATDWEGFRQNAILKGLKPEDIAAIGNIYETCKSLNANVVWGRGTVTATFSPKWPWLHASVSPFTVFANGTLELHLIALKTSDRATKFSEAFGNRLVASGVNLPQNYQNAWVTLSSDDWISHSQDFLDGLKEAIQVSQQM
ncbi:hypothetical protein [Occallatibacter savannae]|uniref:hypothetical protein n=1 Tax=Occallatibacter savannae TaxID=1002691 RepID=UPI000D68830C|nr:hypothetical protein [Occallatibacter savannae]